MNQSFSLGRIAGVRVGVNWSVLVIFGLIVYGLAGVQFPRLYPGYVGGAYLLAGLAAAVVFVASLLAHELAHAVVARRNGMTVEGITLWLFGGVARLSGEAPDPGAELRIAGVGPLVSLLLGIGFGVLAVLLWVGGVHGLAIAAVGWLAGINIVLAIFNVVPAAPLDGGRLLRAIVWWRTGDRLRATIAAAQAGRVFGWILIVAGLLLFLTGQLPGGLWLALIGWFLIGAASAEGQQAAVRVALGGLPVSRIMTLEPMTVPASMSVADFLTNYTLSHRHSAYPVVHLGDGAAGDIAGAVVGLVTHKRITEVPPDQRATTLVGQAACPLTEVPGTVPNESVADLLPRLGGCAEGRALVFQANRLVGIVSLSDITRALRWTDVTWNERVSR
ncbi:MAG TPA: site-2 protease family protein [Mycobacteriales bacterium]|nr:site-2 protease family protein [Mycobacteriales bacterium]